MTPEENAANVTRYLILDVGDSNLISEWRKGDDGMLHHYETRPANPQDLEDYRKQQKIDFGR